MSKENVLAYVDKNGVIEIPEAILGPLRDIENERTEKRLQLISDFKLRMETEPPIQTFNGVWDAIGAHNKTFSEILESLAGEISDREIMESALNQSRDFETLTKLQEEKMSFVLAQYGMQGLTYFAGDEQPEIWIEAEKKSRALDIANAVEVEAKKQLEKLGITNGKIYFPREGSTYIGPVISQTQDAFIQQIRPDAVVALWKQDFAPSTKESIEKKLESNKNTPVKITTGCKGSVTVLNNIDATERDNARNRSKSNNLDR